MEPDAPGPVRAAQAAWLHAATTLNATTPASAKAVELALRQGLVITHEQARTCGLTRADLRRLVRRGEWAAPRHGVLCPLPQAAAAATISGTGHQIRAAAAALVIPNTAVSHASATAMHCLPLLKPPGPPTLTALPGSQAFSRPDIRRHVAGMAPDDLELWFGTPVTSVARTIVDLARARGVRHGLVAADAALHEDLTTAEQLQGALARQRGWPGVRAARRAVQLADARAESPLESITRLFVVERGLPVPDLQVWIPTEAGAYRVDLLLAGSRVVIEADGMVKYRDADVRVQEKRREGFLERAGYRVERVLWDDITRRPVQTEARLRAALAAARR